LKLVFREGDPEEPKRVSDINM